MKNATGLPRAPRRRRLTLWILLGVLLVFIGAELWVGVRGSAAADELSEARALATDLREQMTSGNSTEAAATLKQVGTHTAAALSLTSDPVWQAMELIPFAGPNLVAVRESARAVDDLVTGVATPLLPVTGDLDAGSFAGASIPIQPLIDAAPMAREASDAAEDISNRVSQIEASRTLPFIREAVLDLGALVTEVTEVVQSIDRATTLLPNMLGAEGPRNYLLLFQNNAELRASGGIAGATAVVTVTNGNLSLGAQRSTLDYPRLAQPVLPLTQAEATVHGTILGRYIQDVNLTPDFSRTGELARAMAEPVVGIPLDGVIAIDPYVLAYILGATGPVQLSNGETLTSENAVKLFLSDVYATIPDPAEQDSYFASVTNTVFTALSTRDVDPAKLLAAIGRSGDEGRIRVWSADPAEQEVIAETTMAGVPADESEAVVGVFLNDATGGKMDYYLSTTVALSCSEEEEQRVTVKLSNGAPADAATSLTGYVTGNGVYGVPKGSIRTQVIVVLPPGARAVLRSGSESTVVRNDAGLVVLSRYVEIQPGRSDSVVVTYADAVPNRVVATPGVDVSPERGQALCP